MKTYKLTLDDGSFCKVAAKTDKAAVDYIEGYYSPHVVKKVEELTDYPIKARMLIEKHGLDGARKLAEAEAMKSLETNLEQRKWAFVLGYLDKQ